MSTYSTRRLAHLEDERRHLRELLIKLREAAGTPAGEFYVVPVEDFDAVMHAVGLDPKREH